MFGEGESIAPNKSQEVAEFREEFATLKEEERRLLSELLKNCLRFPQGVSDFQKAGLLVRALQLFQCVSPLGSSRFPESRNSFMKP